MRATPKGPTPRGQCRGKSSGAVALMVGGCMWSSGAQAPKAPALTAQALNATAPKGKALKAEALKAKTLKAKTLEAGP